MPIPCCFVLFTAFFLDAAKLQKNIVISKYFL
jgi:hypothetical protein